MRVHLSQCYTFIEQIYPTIIPFHEIFNWLLEDSEILKQTCNQTVFICYNYEWKFPKKQCYLQCVIVYLFTSETSTVQTCRKKWISVIRSHISYILAAFGSYYLFADSLSDTSYPSLDYSATELVSSIFNFLQICVLYMSIWWIKQFDKATS